MIKLFVKLLLLLIITITGCGGDENNNTKPTEEEYYNSLPNANAGLDQKVTSEFVINLDGSASSDENVDSLNFHWEFISKPQGSSAKLSDSTIHNPTFNAYFQGKYVLSLIVDDGLSISPADYITIEKNYPETPYNYINMHDEVLLGKGFQPGESGGLKQYTIKNNALLGDRSIELDSSANLVPGQLVIYESTNLEYYTATIDQIHESVVTFNEPIKTDIMAGNYLTNFYRNDSHPNAYGYKAISDYTIRHFSIDSLNFGVHVMFGDSWFAGGVIQSQLEEKLSNAVFINEGVGGNTIYSLKDRFDSDVIPAYPDFVWLMIGTNDYFSKISTDAYIWGVQELIDRIEKIGAKAIIFSPSVGPVEYGSEDFEALKIRSDEYAAATRSIVFTNLIDH